MINFGSNLAKVTLYSHSYQYIIALTQLYLNSLAGFISPNAYLGMIFADEIKIELLFKNFSYIICKDCFTKVSYIRSKISIII